MSYARARFERDVETLSYRVYVTDQLRLLGQGMTRSDRWADSVLPQTKDERTAEEIIDDVLARMGQEEA